MLNHFEEQLRAIFQGRTVLITGATGTMGQAMARRILNYEPSTIRLFSRDEYKQYVLKEEIGHIPQYRFLLGDVRDLERVQRAMQGVDIVLHTAALKHLPACEYNPFEAIKTNVIGTQNVIQACLQNNVKKMLLTSSDKAISPENTLGATKLLAERLITAMAHAKGTSSTTFCAVRFGNVLGSRGSVVNRFIEDLRNRQPIKVTDINMTRFMMSIDQAVSLVLKALVLSQGGDVFVLKMPVIRLGDLVDVLIEEFQERVKNNRKSDIKIQTIGIRPGEKMYEELISEEESKIAWEWGDMFVLPPWWNTNPKYPGAIRVSSGLYSSRDIPPLSKKEIKSLLLDSHLLSKIDG
ncbi:membrane protein [Collibacillus ludicampi]|uniref:Membrane protein n=1 Tax=Collibacillus ludicampi TaxID=2771369 RepID=A0AAV4LF63_9BACL|nr:SDR family NAD(P)-dependent oxidoreductase [Collibacillus ludicampi]GIM46469.1 membrane protein [Collibacillus ludicampi]